MKTHPATAATGTDLEVLFHPAVAGWFRDRFVTPTEVQLQAWRSASDGQHTLVCAPTGSGKTLAAFLSAINSLVVEGLERPLEDRVQVLYVSPLKALSNDIEKNLQEPLAGIRDKLLEHGLPDVPIRSAVRTGDTSEIERNRMRRSPPHILVTTPESLFILLTSDSGRDMLHGVRSIIIDELHAVAGSKRGAHLMLSLERLRALSGNEPVRIGLSATVKPVKDMAAFLLGERSQPVTVIDSGHVRDRDLAIEVPRSPLSAVMANEVWEEVYDRLAELIETHRTTLVFVNTRRLAERAARHLAEHVGAEHVTAHHGSLAKEHRLRAEQRLKSGELKVLVATASLELGIDIGSIDLVCQLGSPRSIAAFLQRVGRAGHAIGAVPKGRLFPLTLDELLECTVLMDQARRGELDQIQMPSLPMDVLAQQIVAEVACGEWIAGELYGRFRTAYPYRRLEREDFDKIVIMLAEGYATRWGRRGAYIHYDAVNKKLRPRRGARLTAVTNAGVISDQFDYDVVLVPEEHRVGTLNEDFAFESMAGDIFQLGNTSYRIIKIETGKVFVEDANGQPPTIPFWFGEAPARTQELSAAVAQLLENADRILEGEAVSLPSEGWDDEPVARLKHWFTGEFDLPPTASAQLAQYLAAAKTALSVLPGQHTIVFERFFDELGDLHLVIHSPFGSRINRAWGLALRKRFCRQFNFELQAAALEDSIVLSLGPSHSFELETVRDYLKSATARDVLVQALLDAPLFLTRWRFNVCNALAVKRTHGGKRRPPQFQRADAEDLLSVVFPDLLACAENLTAGYRDVPDHPLVRQTLQDCLHEAMDIEGFERLLARIESGEIQVIARDLTGPSPLSQAILNARPYAFLDDGAAEERRTRAVRSDRQLSIEDAAALGKLDPEAIARVRSEAWPQPVNVDELHDALLVGGFLTGQEGSQNGWTILFETLRAENRAALLNVPSDIALWIAAERSHEFLAVFPHAQLQPALPLLANITERETALREIMRSRLDILGPVTAEALARSLNLAESEVHAALIALESEGSILRGSFSHDRLSPVSKKADSSHLLPPPKGGKGGIVGNSDTHEWCERRLLARIHRYTRDRLRGEIQPVTATKFMRFLFHWQRLRREDADERGEGEARLLAVIQQLEGCPVPAAAWESDILPVRVKNYVSSMLDRLCASGRIIWSRPQQRGGDELRRSSPVRTTPILLCERAHFGHWNTGSAEQQGESLTLGSRAQGVYDVLKEQGASFFSDLIAVTGFMRTELESALGELVTKGLVTCDSFAGLRALVRPAAKQRRRGYRAHVYTDSAEAGRWSLIRHPIMNSASQQSTALADPAVEHVARVLLQRYGVVFRRLLDRESGLPPWRELHYVYRRLEARGEIRGGRFVSGFSGEQFALPGAATILHKIARGKDEELVVIPAVDPLNLTGILLPGDRVPAVSGNRLLFSNGVLVAVMAGGEFKCLQAVRPESELKQLLVRKPASTRRYWHTTFND